VTTIAPTPQCRSAFGAAFLSFLVPGLGQAYAGAYLRAIALVVPPLIAAGIIVALFLSYGLVDFGLWVGQTSVLGPLAILNVVLLVYRAAASIDAYRLLIEPCRPGVRSGIWRIGRKPGQISPHSLVGLEAILIVMVAGHAIVGYWDVRFYNLARDVHAPVAIDTAAPDASPEPEPSISFPPQETLAPAPTIQPWTGTARLNILLVGVDQTTGFRTDSMIVVSIDPVTDRVVMFSMPRDTISVPMPPKSRLAQLWGPYFNYKLNALWKYSDSYRNLFPGGGAEALRQALGYAFFGDQNAIPYYVMVDFAGFQKVVDTLGGVTIDVPAPVIDDGYPGNHGDGQHERIYIPAGIQHMTGDQALDYARSRKGSVLYNDYNRSNRQQQILIALEQQANLDAISAHLGDLVDALSSTIHTDLPEGPDVLGPMIQLARSIKPADIKTYAFAPPGYGTASSDSNGYVFVPDMAAIRSAVKGAISGAAKSPDQLQAAVDEAAPIVVENGTGVSGQDSAVATYLQALGLDAQASADQPPQLGGVTKLLCIDGANETYPSTLLELEKTLGLTGTPSTDPAAAIQIVTEPNEAVGFAIETGTNLPTLTTPSG
jgi:LCP family protein required for cell wall assembly